MTRLIFAFFLTACATTPPEPIAVIECVEINGHLHCEMRAPDEPSRWVLV